jgi:NAD(P)-dependent dehydrogenase (short-subunit alcohol dehydrogenase family)
VLINNAGVMGPGVTHTADVFEARMGVNHLGHFALTCLLGDRIRDRVISLASAMHALVRLPVHDLGGLYRTPPAWRGYSESKLAILQFTYELARRAAASAPTPPIPVPPTPTSPGMQPDSPLG